MIWARFHQASADELQNGRIVCRFGNWLTFFNGGDLFFDSAFLAQNVVLGDDGILVNGVRLFWAGRIKTCHLQSINLLRVWCYFRGKLQFTWHYTIMNR